MIVDIADALLKAPFSIAGGVSTWGITSQGHVSALGLALSAVGGILQTLTAPLLAGVIVLLYTDLLMRREGMDIKLQAAAASGAAGYAGVPGAGGAAEATWAGPAGQPGQPGWGNQPAGPGTTGWDNTVGWPETSPPAQLGRTDGGKGTSAPDPNAW